jgi:hypothetical protein
MCEKLVNSAWRVVLVALITIGALLTSTLLYQSVLLALNMRWERFIPTLIGGSATGVGVWMLCRHRNDLICD